MPDTDYDVIYIQQNHEHEFIISIDIEKSKYSISSHHTIWNMDELLFTIRVNVHIGTHIHTQNQTMPYNLES